MHKAQLNGLTERNVLLTRRFTIAVAPNTLKENMTILATANFPYSNERRLVTSVSESKCSCDYLQRFWFYEWYFVFEE